MRPWKKILVFGLVVLVVGFSAFSLWLSNHHVVPIMMYHHVDYTEKRRSDTVSPENFDYQMGYLHKHGYNVLSLNDYIERKISGETLPRRSVVITFDDGYDNFSTKALDILKKYQLPSTMFMPSDRIDVRGHLSLEQLKEVVQSGIVEIGSHTRNHIYLPALSYKDQKDEITESKRILEETLNIKVDSFSYPIGGFSRQAKDLVKKAGYKSAFTTNRGFDRMNNDIFEMNRIRFGDGDTHWWDMWIKLSGYYNLTKKLKYPY